MTVNNSPVQGDMQRHVRHLRSTAAYRWFSNRDVRAFYSSLAAPTIRHGVQVLLQVMWIDILFLLFSF